MTTLAALTCWALDAAGAAVLVVADGHDAERAVVAQQGPAAATRRAGSCRANLAGWACRATAAAILVVRQRVHAGPTAQVRVDRTNNRAGSGEATVSDIAGVTAGAAICRIAGGLRTVSICPGAAQLVARVAAHAAQPERADLARRAGYAAGAAVLVVGRGICTNGTAIELAGRAGRDAGRITTDHACAAGRAAGAAVRRIGREIHAAS